MATHRPTEEEKRQWHADPANWFLGVFYHNKEDKRLFPPKRSYLGWTVNFANPYSILAMFVLVGVVLFVVALVADP